MFAAQRLKPLLYGGVGLTLTLILMLAWPVLADMLFTTRGYVPHGFCILWDQQLLWLHVVTDFLIGLSYVSIALTLTYLVYRARRAIPFHSILLAFGAFIFTCSGTHFMSVWTFWQPVYWLSGNVKLVTAFASVATAIALPPLIPRMLSLVNAARVSQERKQQLELANAELAGLYARIKELDDAKSRFFTNISHELRTPLTLILGPTERLLESGTIDAGQRHDLETIDHNARMLLRHVGDLLDIARLEAGRMELNYSRVDLAQLVRFTAVHFTALARERQITFAVTAPPTAPAEIDAAKVQQMVLNLLSNAFKFTPAGGEIHCSLSVADESATIVMADSGPGVRPELRSVIFERFRQGDPSGRAYPGSTGLGLAITRELVELHGGTITVGDAPMGGASFCVTLPLNSPPHIMVDARAIEVTDSAEKPAVELASRFAPAPDATAVTAAATEDAALILVVEDNPDMQRFIGETLAGTYRVATAGDGVEGLTQVHALQPDLILSDVMMPAMSGDQLVQAVRAHAEFDAIPIVLLTARADNELCVRALQLGAQDYLVKPFSVAELQARLGNLIAMKRTRDLLQHELTSQSQDLAALAGEVTLRKRELELALEQLQQHAEENTRLYREVREALRMREEFLLVAAHELKTPLTSLLGYAQLLQRRSSSQAVRNERNMRAVRAIAEQSTHLNRLVGMLLDLARIDQNTFHLNTETLNLSALVQHMMAVMQPTLEQHTLESQFPPAPAIVYGDAARLEQLFFILMSNAIKYSPAGGSIHVQLVHHDQTAELSVADQGIGIPPAAVPHLFQRFYRAPNVNYRYISGMGIGLYLAHEIVQRHHGEITVTSTEGIGSTFTVRLPVAPP